MQIGTDEVREFAERQIKVFKTMPYKSDFSDGAVEGFNMVVNFLNILEEREGNLIATERGEK